MGLSQEWDFADAHNMAFVDFMVKLQK